VPRTSLRDRLQSGSQQPPQGREALYQSPAGASSAQTEDAARKPLTVDGGPSTEGSERWDDSHTRVTFYCPVPLLRAIEEEVKNSDRSKSQVIVDALRGHLQGRRSRRD
jgi:hypothetical protein